jgi:hypothetical protein
METEEPAGSVCVMLLEAGERLLAALGEERRVSRLAGGEREIPVEIVVAARMRVDECADMYCRALEECGFPDVPIRHLVECNLTDS